MVRTVYLYQGRFSFDGVKLIRRLLGDVPGPGIDDQDLGPAIIAIAFVGGEAENEAVIDGGGDRRRAGTGTVTGYCPKMWGEDTEKESGGDVIHTSRGRHPSQVRFGVTGSDELKC